MARLDLDHLARQTMNDADLQRDVLRIFEQQMAEKLTALANPQGSVKEVAHSIKGSARGVGAFEVAALAEALEADGSFNAALIDQLRAAVEETMNDIRELITPLP